jgi:transcriptional regulator with XRE-family HTH domain
MHQPSGDSSYEVSKLTFGEELKKLRKSADFSQAELGDIVGVSNTYISALESGRKPAPPHALVQALSAALNISDKHLWQAARAEREARLQDRINGMPTSLRISKAAPESEASQSDLPSGFSNSSGAIANLVGIISTSSDKESLIELLEALLDTLRE